MRIDIKTNFQCNNCCKFCIQGDKRLHKPNKTTEEIKQILKENSDESCGVVFTGGEVTIRKDIFEIVSFAKKCRYKSIQIQSNGRMFFYMDFCKRLIDAGVSEFAPAIHGSTKKMHDGLTRAEGSFEQTLQGILNLKKLKQRIITNTVITRINYKDLPNIAKLLTEIGVNQYQFAFMHINNIIQEDKAMVEELVPRYKEVKLLVEQGLQVGIDGGLLTMVEAFPYCTLNKEYHKHIAENFIPETYIFEDSKKTNFKKMKKQGAKLKGESCKECRFYKKCEGPWSDYAELFGFNEFKPIKK
ncbi:MAG: radical SAM protein [Candidatus Paceibacterota bacterium]